MLAFPLVEDILRSLSANNVVLLKVQAYRNCSQIAWRFFYFLRGEGCFRDNGGVLEFFGHTRGMVNGVGPWMGFAGGRCPNSFRAFLLYPFMGVRHVPAE